MYTVVVDCVVFDAPSIVAAPGPPPAVPLTEVLVDPLEVLLPTETVDPEDPLGPTLVVVLSVPVPLPPGEPVEAVDSLVGTDPVAPVPVWTVAVVETVDPGEEVDVLPVPLPAVGELVEPFDES